MRIHTRLVSTFALLAMLGHAPLHAQDQDSESTAGGHALMGEINIEDSGPARNTYAETQAAAIQYFQNLSDVIATLSQGAQSASIPAADDNTLSYLTAAYLYCSVHSGECPLLLDAILEADLINSRVSKIAQCPNMTRFWKLWVRSDMEARHKYMVKTGYLKTTADFNQQKRPAYIKCQQTITKEIAGTASDDAYFKARYAADSSHTLVAARAAKLLEEIKAKVPNVFAAVGTSFGAASSAGSAREPSKKSNTRR